MLSYFAAWILEAGQYPDLRRAVRPSTPLGKAGEGRSRQLRDGAELARQLQLDQENAKTIFVRRAAFARLRGQQGRPFRATRQEDLR